jgi:predicted site-specific integrase-resolvase
MGNGVNSLHVWCNSESGNVSINVDIGLSFSLRSGYGRMSMFDESLIKIKYQFLIKDRLISTFHMFVLFTVLKSGGVKLVLWNKLSLLVK